MAKDDTKERERERRKYSDTRVDVNKIKIERSIKEKIKLRDTISMLADLHWRETEITLDIIQTLLTISKYNLLPSRLWYPFANGKQTRNYVLILSLLHAIRSVLNEDCGN